MEYKVNDHVRIKSLDWYNKNKDEYGNINVSHDFTFYADRSKYCGKVFTIDEVFDNWYTVKEDNHEYYWADEMIEGLVKEETQPKFKVGDRVITNKGYIGKFEGWVSDYQVRVLFEESGCNVVIHPKDLKLAEEETKPNVIEEAKTYWDSIKDAWICPDGYIFKDENGNVINATKIVLEKKKKEYPKTYGECCRVLFIDEHEVVLDYLNKSFKIKDYSFEHLCKLNVLSKLLICRDAYWKIAGEEMGLNRPWEPQDTNTFSIFYDRLTGEIEKQDGYCGANSTLEFPTEEMRDAFYENFDPDIEFCKELL